MNQGVELGLGRQLWWLVLFAIVLALLGGSSRPDMVQLIAMRPIAALFLIPALYYLTLQQLKSAKALAWLLFALASWMAIQLVPLPPSVWHSLPDRSGVADLDRLIGLEDAWRPISMVPSRGWNALASMVVPITALLLALAMRVNARTLLLLVASLGALDAILGLLQVISGSSSSLYFYSITNRGSPVGIFANENHSAVFSAVALIVVGFLGLSSRKWREPIWLRLGYAPVFITILVALLVSGSRAGIAMGFVALVVVAMTAALFLGGSNEPRRRGRGNAGRARRMQDWIVSHPGALMLLAAAIIAGLLTLFISLDRSAGFEDVFNKDAFADVRWELLPILQQMAAAHWGLGSGFGSFEEVYHLYEPTQLLLPSYVNQAHNDWLQIVIEGGAPAIAILLALLLWVISSLRALFLRSGDPGAQILMYGAVIAVIAGSSLVDYPLRSPSFQAISVWILLSLALAGRDENKPAVGHG